MGIQKKRCKFFLELITSTLTITFNPLYRQSYIKTSLDLLRLSLTFLKFFNKNPLRYYIYLALIYDFIERTKPCKRPFRVPLSSIQFHSQARILQQHNTRSY